MTKYVLFNPKGMCEGYTVKGKSYTLRKMETAELSQEPDSCTPGIRISTVKVPDEKTGKKKGQPSDDSSEG